MPGVFAETDNPPRQFWFLAYFRGRPQQGWITATRPTGNVIKDLRDGNGMDSLDMRLSDNYARRHDTNPSQTRWFRTAGRIRSTTYSPENIAVHIHSMILKSHEPSAFKGAGFAGLFDGLPAYTSKTPSTPRYAINQ